MCMCGFYEALSCPLQKSSWDEVRQPSRREKSAAAPPSFRARRRLASQFNPRSSFPNFPKRKVVKVVDVRKLLGVSQDELSRMTGYSIRAIAGWESGKVLSEAARPKIVETDRLGRALAEIVPSAELGDWLRTPNPAFEGQSPLQVVERGEADRIWRMIVQIDAGAAN